MNMKRKIGIVACLILLFFIAGYGALSFYKYHRQKQYLKSLLVNAVYENADQDVQKRIIEVYGERIGIDFPDSTKVLFANAEKGDLLDSTYYASLKMELDTEDRRQLEIQLDSKYKKASLQEAKYLFSDFDKPTEIWKPGNLKDYNIYHVNIPYGILIIGLDETGRVLVYLVYATI